jgi:F0F1-type ATP synthase assembly protein I
MENKSKFLAIGLVLGAGIGIIAGSAFGSIPMGIVFGGGFGLILGLAIGDVLERRTEL